MEAFLHLLADGKVNVGPLITHRFPIDRARNAYDLILGRTQESFLGVVIEYAQTAEASPTLQLVSRTVPATSAVDHVSVGLLGAGVFACNTLIPAMKSSGITKLTAVCAANGSHAAQAAKKFSFAACTTNESQIIQTSEANTVVIATRHHLHAAQTLAALAAGKHVFCEKPLCLSESELRSIVRAYSSSSAERHLAMMVGFNRRFAPMVVQMKSFLSSITEPLALHYRINAGSLPSEHWINDREQGGGRILGEVCHFVDLLMFLAGSPIVEVEARSIGNSDRYSGGNVLAALRFSDGSQGTISYLSSGDRAFSKERIEVFGGGSTAVLDDFRTLELSRHGRKRTFRSRWRQDKGHDAEWAAFAEAVTGRADAPIPFEDLVCSTLATLRLDESVTTAERLAVDPKGFIAAALHAPNSSE
jgi:predicted dehydrogenase